MHKTLLTIGLAILAGAEMTGCALGPEARLPDASQSAQRDTSQLAHEDQLAHSPASSTPAARRLPVDVSSSPGKSPSSSVLEAASPSDDPAAAIPALLGNAQLLEAKPAQDEWEPLLAQLRTSGRMSAEEVDGLSQDLRSAPASLRPLLLENLRAVVATPVDLTAASPPRASVATNPETPLAANATQNFLASAAETPVSLPPESLPQATVNPLRKMLEPPPLPQAPTTPPTAPGSEVVSAAEAQGIVDANQVGATSSPVMMRISDRGEDHAAAVNPSRSAPASGQPVALASNDRSTPATAGSKTDATTAEEEPLLAPGAWEKDLTAAIRGLEAEVRRLEREGAETRASEAYLRLLYLVAQRHQDAVRPIGQLDPAEQAFWTHQLHGLTTCLDPQGMPVASRRATLALRELRMAVASLAETSNLDVRNLAFCTSVESFGRYTEFDKSAFRPGQEAILYAEVDNFTVEQSNAGYETALQGSYQILDASGRSVGEHTFPAEREVCRNRRRDYFVPYSIWFPKNIAPGRYTLQLTMEDLKGKRFGQSSLAFSIVE